jgi:hypothetical protein
MKRGALFRVRSKIPLRSSSSSPPAHTHTLKTHKTTPSPKKTVGAQHHRQPSATTCRGAGYVKNGSSCSCAANYGSTLAPGALGALTKKKNTTLPAACAAASTTASTRNKNNNNNSLPRCECKRCPSGTASNGGPLATAQCFKAAPVAFNQSIFINEPACNDAHGAVLTTMMAASLRSRTGVLGASVTVNYVLCTASAPRASSAAVSSSSSSGGSRVLAYAFGIVYVGAPEVRASNVTLVQSAPSG